MVFALSSVILPAVSAQSAPFSCRAAVDGKGVHPTDAAVGAAWAAPPVRVCSPAAAAAISLLTNEAMQGCRSPLHLVQHTVHHLMKCTDMGQTDFVVAKLLVEIIE
uniref:Uncharacterized protein n=1 Tax=Pristionchus pacificus TaxID=54126 RepID=A0A2A6B2V7_PRIPA|eukprot:PDM60217.1 hypothetical protein PRIPAC_54042 [Pristionchus pacificus]